ncbi:MAG: hypothetical protein AAB971_01570 [Patescibacteria group bacterium]
MRRLRHLRLLLLSIITVLTVLGLSTAGASTAGASLANISHSYHSSKSIVNGSIVGLDPKKTDYVQAASTKDGSRLLGVAVASNDSLLAVDATADTIQVATSGIVTTLVSTLNGNINVGDQVAVSPFTGVGMKALPGAHVIGLAQTSFTGKSDGATTQEIANKDGKKTKVAIGYIRLTIAVGTGNISSSEAMLNSLQKIAKALTGRTISTVRVVVALLVALVGLATLVTLIYAAIYGSIISVGRNPLAKYAIFRTLSSVLAMAVLTGVVVAATIFFLLR